MRLARERRTGRPGVAAVSGSGRHLVGWEAEAEARRASAKAAQAYIPAREHAAAQLQVAYRRHLSARLVTTVRHHLAPPAADVKRLHALWHRVATRAAIRIQFYWRRRRGLSVTKEAAAATREGRALQSVERAVLRQKEARMAAALREQAEREVAELKAAVALQAEARRRSAVQLAEKTVRQAAMGRLRETFGATREMRAAGKVQRCWLARCARRAEQEANEAAQAAEQLADRLARARGTELRQRHYARLIAGAMREHIGRRLAVVHGAPAARPQLLALASLAHRARAVVRPQNCAAGCTNAYRTRTRRPGCSGASATSTSSAASSATTRSRRSAPRAARAQGRPSRCDCCARATGSEISSASRVTRPTMRARR